MTHFLEISPVLNMNQLKSVISVLNYILLK